LGFTKVVNADSISGVLQLIAELGKLEELCKNKNSSKKTPSTSLLPRFSFWSNSGGLLKALAQLKTSAQRLRKMQESTGNPIVFLEWRIPAQRARRSRELMSGSTRMQSKHFVAIAKFLDCCPYSAHETLVDLSHLILGDKQDDKEVTLYRFLINATPKNPTKAWVRAEVRLTTTINDQ
jgi:hypothetical protein